MGGEFGTFSLGPHSLLRCAGHPTHECCLQIGHRYKGKQASFPVKLDSKHNVPNFSDRAYIYFVKHTKSELEA